MKERPRKRMDVREKRDSSHNRGRQANIHRKIYSQGVLFSLQMIRVFHGIRFGLE